MMTSPDPAINKPLVWTGALLLLIGVVLVGVIFFRGAGSPIVEPAARGLGVSRAWSVIAGLLFASGLAGIGIGMNKWRQRK